MKKFYYIVDNLVKLSIVAVLLFIPFLIPQNITAQSTASYGVVVTSLSTSGTGAVTGTSFAVPSTYAAIITWQVVADGSAQSTNLEGSLDNTTFFTVDSNTVATGGIRNFGFTGIKFVRISQVSRTGGTVTTGTIVTNRGFINQAGVTLNNPIFTGQVLLPDGVVATPSIAFTSNTGSGWYKGGTDQWNFATGGVNRAFFSSSNFTFPATIYVGTSQDASISRAAAGELTTPAVAFAALGTPANGTSAYCSDCAPVTPASCPATKASCICAGAGVGSWAFRANSVWYCPF